MGDLSDEQIADLLESDDLDLHLVSPEETEAWQELLQRLVQEEDDPHT